MMFRLVFLATFLSHTPQTLALDNGLALTPPMGWMSWLYYGCGTNCDKDPKKCLSEDLIKRTVDRLVSDGYKDAGYEYVIIDDCWLEKNRSADGKMVPDRKRFKSGMNALAEYIHSNGLKFGMYQDIGTYTCEHYPGLENHEAVDAKTFAGWEIDYLKVDGCYEQPSHMSKSYPAFGKILNVTGRPILYSCSWPAYAQPVNYTAVAENCNIWRNYGDISCSWSSILNIMDWFGNQPELDKSAGPGHFHDPDMLVVGNTCISKEQAEAQMGVWAILAAPLLISTDLDLVKPEYKKILLNKELIKISQDRSGRMGRRISHTDKLDFWLRILTDSTALVIVNRQAKIAYVEFTLKELGLESDVDFDVKDLFNEKVIFTLRKGDKIKTKIQPTGVKFYKLLPKV